MDWNASPHSDNNYNINDVIQVGRGISTGQVLNALNMTGNKKKTQNKVLELI